MPLSPFGTTEIARRVRRVAERVSGRPVEDMATPLFDLGWDSLDAVEFEVELENEFGVPVCCDGEDVAAVNLQHVVAMMARALAAPSYAAAPVREAAPA